VKSRRCYDHADHPALAVPEQLGGCNVGPAGTWRSILHRLLATGRRGRACIARLRLVARFQEPALAFHRRRHRCHHGTRRAARAHWRMGAHNFPCRSNPAATPNRARRHGNDLRCAQHGRGHDNPRSANARHGGRHDTIGRSVLRK